MKIEIEQNLPDWSLCNGCKMLYDVFLPVNSIGCAMGYSLTVEIIPAPKHSKIGTLNTVRYLRPKKCIEKHGK